MVIENTRGGTATTRERELNITMLSELLRHELAIKTKNTSDRRAAIQLFKRFRRVRSCGSFKCSNFTFFLFLLLRGIETNGNRYSCKKENTNAHTHTNHTTAQQTIRNKSRQHKVHSCQRPVAIDKWRAIEVRMTNRLLNGDRLTNASFLTI